MDENTVISALCTYLTKNGYEVRQRLHTTEQGVDILARERVTGRDLVVEAKGATSSREGSTRFGKGFTRSQVFDRVAKGVFTALELRAKHRDRSRTDVALAVPDSSMFRKYLEPVKTELAAAGIRVFFVDASAAVSELDS